MYCQRHVERRIALAESYQRDQGNPFHIKYHETWEIDEFEAYLHHNNKYTYDDQSNPIGVKNLSAEDARFILNEQILMQCDAAYAMTRYCYVIDEVGRIARFNFRLAQAILFDVISDLENKDLAIELMILKARQLGMTTVVQLLILLRIAFGYGINAISASAEIEKSGLMADKLFMAYDKLPVWLRPQWTSRADQTVPKKLVFRQLNTRLSVQHGNKMSGGIAQGWTPTIYHISEVALMARADIQIDEGLHKAVHPSPSVLGVLESTGASDEGWWAETWHYSKENWPNCRLYPLFLPWFCGIEIYPMPVDLIKSPIPLNFYENRMPDTQEHVARAEAYVACHPMLRKHLGMSWKMPLKQQWFWELGHEEAKAKGKEGLWYQGMAGDDIEALQRSSESVFGYDTMVEVEKAASTTMLAFGLTGQSIEDHHEPPTEDIDYGTSSAPRTREIVTYNSNRGDSYRWELIPLHHDMAFVESLKTKPDAFREYANGKLMVFHPPTPGIDYSIGVDTSNGMGEDSTVICVTAPAQRRGQPDVQVAEFRSAYVSHVEAYAFIMCIAAYYSKFMEDSTPHRNPLVGVEQIASVGDVAQVQMRKMGYTRFPSFIRYDGKDLKKQKSRKIGWYTNVWSRPILVDSFVHSVQNGWYVINSPWLIDECKHFEVHYTASGKEKKEHEEGEHDDGLFAAAISEIIVNDLKSMTERSKKRFGAAENQALPPINVEPYRGHTFSTKIGGSRDITMSEIIYSSTAELDRWR
jgi:hypothetical protein